MKIVLTGGGTLGSVSPLIAVWQQLVKRDNSLETLFLGTFSGPEKNFLNQYSDIKFKPIPSGKLRRYFSLKNFIDPFLIAAGFFSSFFILLKFKPQVIFSAGGFVSVPVIFAGKLLGIKIIIHQLDIEPTLSNKLVQNKADKITVTFEKSLNDFPKEKTVLVGSVLRDEIKNLSLVSCPLSLLILGGGTGALSLNKLIQQTVPLLSKKIKIHHVTGKGKQTKIKSDNYHQYELLTDDYYQKITEASMIITRAGLSTLMELSYLAKPSIIIPIPDSHQVANAKYFSDKNGGIYLEQNKLSPQIWANKIKALLGDENKIKALGKSINTSINHGGETKIANLIYEFKQK